MSEGKKRGSVRIGRPPGPAWEGWEKLARAGKLRAIQVRHWHGKTEELRTLIAEGWSTHWISIKLRLPKEAVRDARKRLT